MNGSSLVIWAWGPPLYLALRRAAGWDPKVRGDVHYERIRLILVVMYVVVVIAMGAIPYLSGWRGSPVLALAMGNLYHLVAAGVGLVFTLAWSPLIESRLVDLRAPQGPTERLRRSLGQTRRMQGGSLPSTGGYPCVAVSLAVAHERADSGGGPDIAAALCPAYVISRGCRRPPTGRPATRSLPPPERARL